MDWIIFGYITVYITVQYLLHSKQTHGIFRQSSHSGGSGGGGGGGEPGETETEQTGTSGTSTDRPFCLSVYPVTNHMFCGSFQSSVRVVDANINITVTAI